MKSFVVVLVALCFSLQTKASSWKLIVQNQSRYIVNINGIHSEGKKQFSFHNLPEGYHHVEIILVRPHYNYGTSCSPRQEVVFSGDVFLPYQTKVVSAFDGYHLNQLKVKPLNNSYDQGCFEHNDNHISTKRRHKRSCSSLTCRGCYSANTSYRNSNRSNSNHSTKHHSSYSNTDSYSRNTWFNTLMRDLKNESFDDNKIELINWSLQGKRVNTYQVKMLIEEISFDKSKLNIAKTAYYIVDDPQNYYQLTKKFSFSSTQKKFRQFLRKNNI